MTQKFSRRHFLQFASLAAGVAVLAGCPAPAPQTSAPATGSDAAAPAAETKAMEAWSRMTDVAQESIIGIIDQYNAENTVGATVEFVFIAQTQGSQADEKLLTAVAGGTPPAVYYADRFTVPQFAYQGFFTNINDFAEAAGVTKDLYWDFAWEETIYKDNIYALSFDTDTRALWYNKDIFTEVGLDPEAPPTNQLELQEIADQLTVRNASGAITRFGFHPTYDQASLYTWGFAYEGTFQDPESKRITFATENNIKAAEQIKALSEHFGNEDLDAMRAACAGGACSGEKDPFWTEQSAMTCSGNWKVAQAARFKPDTNWGVVPFPGPDGPAPHASWAGGWSWCVPMGYEDVATAFDAVAFFCGPVGQEKYNKDTFHIPTIKSLAEDPFFTDDPLHKLFMELLPVSHSRPPIPLGSQLWDLQVQAYTDIIPHGTKTPEQALVDIDTEINAALEEAGFFS